MVFWGCKSRPLTLPYPSQGPHQHRAALPSGPRHFRAAPQQAGLGHKQPQRVLQWRRRRHSDAQRGPGDAQNNAPAQPGPDAARRPAQAPTVQMPTFMPTMTVWMVAFMGQNYFSDISRIAALLDVCPLSFSFCIIFELLLSIMC